jgi:hypothetical protein
MKEGSGQRLPAAFVSSPQLTPSFAPHNHRDPPVEGDRGYAPSLTNQRSGNDNALSGLT